MSVNTKAMDSVLSLLRQTAAQADGGQTAKPASGGNFAQSLRKAVNEVNGEQQHAEHLVDAKAAGAPLDIGRVMVAVQKADLSFQEMVEVRNKVVSAYDEIMNLQI